MNELKEVLRLNPVYSFACLLVALGVLIFAFGKKFFLFRLIFGDRSMFSQILTGLLFCGLGLGLMFLFPR